MIRKASVYNWFYGILITTISALTSLTGYAESLPEHTENKHTAEKFNPGKLIMDHISDAHDWHLWGEGESSVSIPLPVILYDSKKGFDVFSSSRFNHGHSSYHGYKLVENKVVDAAAEELGLEPENEIIDSKTGNDSTIYDISITKNVVTLFFSAIFLIWLFVSVAKSYASNINVAPKGKQSFVEPIITFIRDEVAKPSIGSRYEKYLPYLLTVFFFILINNLLGLIPIIPGGTNLTGNIAVTMSLAVITLIVVTVTANRSYWRHIFAMPGIPIGILVVLTPIEIIGFILRPFVLMIRLFANITAGHIIALSFYSLIFIFGEMNVGLGYGVSVLSIVFTIFMGFLEILVAFLQAYVFTLLTAMYFGAAVEEHHAEEYH